MSVLIRKANLNDLPTVMALLNALYIELGEEQSSNAFLNLTLLEELLTSGKTEILLAGEKNLCVGILTYTETQAAYAGGKYATIDEMFVLPPYRQAGVGKQLIAELKKIALHKNWKRLDVTTPTEESKKKATKFYQSCGFIYTGQKLKIPFPNNNSKNKQSNG
jgi:GNAT superfamily N-acetyltransferase